jgi:exopolysaccharide production protein ExoZ
MNLYSARPAAEKTIKSAQAGRAIAAILVMLFHMNTAFFGSTAYFGTLPFGKIFNIGYSGVDFFFVLSGFIIMKAHEADIGHPACVWIYIYKRIVRIYPAYLVIAIPWIIFGSFFANTHSEFFHSPRNIIASLTLLPIDSPDHTALDVAWTLYHEVFFYAVFSMLILNTRIGSIAVAAMLALSIYGINHTDDPENMFFSFFCNPLHINFVFGMTLEVYLRFFKIPCPLFTFIIGVLGFLTAGAINLLWLPASPTIMPLLYGLTSAISLAGAISSEYQEKISIPTSISTLGNSSYALYLIHVPAISFICKTIVFLNKYITTSLKLDFVICAFLTTYLAVLFHKNFEIPLIHFFKRRKDERFLIAESKERTETRI